MTLTTFPARRRPAALLVATCAAAVTALAGAATADAQKPPKQAVFKATLSGSQVTTWEYRDPRTADPCDSASSVGYGDQTIRFERKSPFKITFIKPPKGNPDLFSSNGRPAVLTEPVPLKVSAEAERNGDYEVTHHPVNRNQCPASADGGGVPAAPERDCGVRTGSFGVKLYFHDSGSSRNNDDDLFVPLDPGAGYPERNHLKLESFFDHLFVDPRDGSATSNLDDTYVNCPFLLENAYTPKVGDIYTSAHRIPERRLFQRSRRRLVLSGSEIAEHKGNRSTGRTILAWNLRLKRVK